MKLLQPFILDSIILNERIEHPYALEITSNKMLGHLEWQSTIFTKILPKTDAAIDVEIKLNAKKITHSYVIEIYSGDGKNKICRTIKDMNANEMVIKIIKEFILKFQL